MESTGEKNMIQVSQDTADLLNASGKGHWLTPRDGPVSVIGKGSILTYWLQPNRRRPSMRGSLTKRLEANLGPGTASLGMRFGLHSGPVTAGVLRGEKSRFQLFGDTIHVVSITLILHYY